MIKTAGTAELEAPDGLHQSLAALQTKTAFLPGYSFRVPENAAEESAGDAEEATEILVNEQLMDECGLEVPLALQNCPVCGMGKCITRFRR